MQLPVKQMGSFYFDTIIIGGGISGLACAERLQESHLYANKHSVVILEARDRIGGRIGAEIVDGKRLDTGANWIHGTGTDQNPNPLLKFVPNLKFKELKNTVAFKSQSSDNLSNSEPCRPDQENEGLVIPPSISTLLFSSLWQLLGSLRERAADLPPDASRDMSMLDAILENDQFRKSFKSVPKAYHQSLSGSPQMLEGMEAAPLNNASAETPEDQAGMSLAEFATSGFDGKQVFLHDGYISVINNLAEQVIANDQIHFDTEVRHVLWDRSPIEVVTNKCTYAARNVVCTIPLGVLKSRLQRDLSGSQGRERALFSPNLSHAKLEAISSLGFGTLDKIFMVYTNAWWNEKPFYPIIGKGMAEINNQSDSAEKVEPDGFRGFTTELPGLHITQEGGIADGPCGLFLVNLHALTGFPVLSAFISCANARRIEALTDQEAGGIVHRALTNWFGGLEPPKPSHVHVTRWAQDIYAKGSYSHRITGKSERRHHAAFAIPSVNAQGNKVRFAGEHTSVEDFATAHGALLSGWREADSIIAEQIPAWTSSCD